MSRYATSFVLGYHGCDKSVGMRTLRGTTKILGSDRDYDWLGPGAYFWEGDPLRAMEWAESKKALGHYAEPFVVGAVIDLGNCLDLMVRENVELLALAHGALEREMSAAKQKMPENRDLKGAPGDKTLRFLDCAVIRQLHQIIDEQPSGGAPGMKRIDPFDTVRGLFQEGDEAYPGARFYAKSHAQIAVRNPTCIKGVFRVRI